MKVSAKGEYAYRAVFELTRHYLSAAEKVIQLDTIARHQHIPRKYLVQILLQLKKAGLVGTVRGVKGGYFLKKPPAEITLGQVLELIDGPPVPVSHATTGTGETDPLQRVLNPVFENIRRSIRQELSLNYEDIYRQSLQNQSGMYYI